MITNFWNFTDRYRNNIAVIDPQNNITLTYEDLFKESETVKKTLNPSGKQLAFLFTENSYSAIIIYLSLIQSGQAVLLLESSLISEIKNEIINVYKPEFIFTPRPESFLWAKKNGFIIGRVQPAF